MNAGAKSESLANECNIGPTIQQDVAIFSLLPEFRIVIHKKIKKYSSLLNKA